MNHKIFALIGKSLSHSYSPQHFNKIFTEQNLPNYFYHTIEISSIDEIRQLVSDHQELCGFNVTFPYKEEIIPYLDFISPIAKEIGAVNVVKVVRENQMIQLHGYNTDCDGFMATLNLIPLNKLHVQKALVLGTGGASKTVQYVLSKMDIQCKVVSREPEKGDITYDLLTEDLYQECQLIVNCTPLGTYPNIDDKPPLDYTKIGSAHILVDLVYNPPLSAFLKMGVEHGSFTINGMTMLKVQADKSWEIFIS